MKSLVNCDKAEEIGTKTKQSLDDLDFKAIKIQCSEKENLGKQLSKQLMKMSQSNPVACSHI